MRISGFVMWVVCAVGLTAGVVRGEDQAAGEPDYGRKGFYAGAGVVYAPSVFDLGDLERAVGENLDSSTAFGADVRLGYRLCRWFSAEYQFQFLSGFDIEGGGETVLSLDTWSMGANGKWFWMTDTFQPYMVGGVGVVSMTARRGGSGTSTQFAGRLGVGADYYFRPQIVFNLEFAAVQPGGPLSDYRYLPLTFGAQYRF